MKNLTRLFLFFLITLLFIGCPITIKTDGPKTSETPATGITDYTINSIAFKMINVPAKTFYTGITDNAAATVNNTFLTAETETTYELWNAVYVWATTISPNVYTFANAGRQGGDNITAADPVGTSQHPVTTINWRDAIVWCNALTEWYNSENAGNLTTVYNSGGIPLRNSTDAAAWNAVTPDTSASGFRLPTNNEWELSARYISDSNGDGDITDSGEYYPGNHASGDTTGYCFPIDGGESAVFDNYSWYSGNTTTTQPVITPALPLLPRLQNSLGIYGMSGNVWELVFDIGANRTARGGSWADTQITLQIGIVFSTIPLDYETNNIGFRFAKNL